MDPDELRRLMGSVVGDAPTFAEPSAPASGTRTARTGWWLAAVLALALLLLLGYVAATRADAAAAAADVAGAAPPPAAVATAAASPAPAAAAETALDASGYVTAARRATVSSVITGRLAEVLVAEGAEVREGQLLARLDARDVEQQIRLAEAQLLSAQRLVVQHQVELAAASAKLRRLRGLHERKFASDDELEAAGYAVQSLQAARDSAAGEIEVARRRLAIQQQLLENTRILAPFDGVVTDRSAQVGEIVSPISAGGGFTRTGICTLVDVDSIEVRVRVNEKHIARVRAGQTVAIMPRAYPALRLRGRVATILPAAERETASIEVIVAFIERDRRVLPNMSVDVSFDRPDATAAAAAATARRSPQ